MNLVALSKKISPSLILRLDKIVLVLGLAPRTLIGIT